MKYIYLLLLLITVSCKPAEKETNATPQTEQASPTLEKATVVTYENLKSDDFKKAIENQDVVVIDVRTPEEIAEGKIENSEELDFYDSDFAERLLAMDKSKEYYIYCKGGGRSAKACRLMIQNGFENVHNLEGGYTAWKKDLVK